MPAPVLLKESEFCAKSAGETYDDITLEPGTYGRNAQLAFDVAAFSRPEPQCEDGLYIQRTSMDPTASSIRLWRAEVLRV